MESAPQLLIPKLRIDHPIRRNDIWRVHNKFNFCLAIYSCATVAFLLSYSCPRLHQYTSLVRWTCAVSPLSHQADHLDRLHPAVVWTTEAPTLLREDARDGETAEIVADGPADGLDKPQDAACPNATAGAGVQLQQTAATSSERADGDGSTGEVDVDSSTATPNCEAPTKVPESC